MLRQAFITKPLFHPLPFLWCIILRWPCGLVGIVYSPITNSCGANLCTIPLQCTMEEEGGRGEKEWQTETGKININVVSSWVLMSTTQDHSGIQMGRKKKKKKKNPLYFPVILDQSCLNSQIESPQNSLFSEWKKQNEVHIKQQKAS